MADEIPTPKADGVGKSLTKKIGPFPGFVWVIIAALLIWGLWFIRTRNAPQASPDGATVIAPDQSADNTGGNSTPGQPGYSGNVVTEQGTPASTTNAQWARNVSNTLIAEGLDPTAVSNAIAKYFNGTALSPQETSIINQALQKFGVPPEGVLPVKNTPATPAPTPKPAPKPAPKPVAKPAAKPAPPKPKSVVYTVRPGDNLSTIAQRYYGRQDWARIYNANRGSIANPNLIFPGQRLTIPL